LNERLSDPPQGVLGRFISRDPIRHSGGLNLYSYTTNPVTFVDPSGLEGCKINGTDEAKDAFLEMAGEAAGVNLSLSWGGKLRIDSYRPFSGNSAASALETLQMLVGSSNTVNINVVYGDPGIPFGGAASLELDAHTIDIKDLENLNRNTDCPHNHGTGALQHELAEAYWMKNGIRFRTPGYSKYDGAGAHGAGGRAEKQYYLDRGFNNVGPVFPSPTQVQATSPGAGDGGFLFNYGQGHTIRAPWSWFAK